MSYSGDVKREIWDVKTESTACKIAELSALILTSGRIILKGRMKFEVAISTAERKVASKIVGLARELYSVKTEFSVSKNMQGKKQNKYNITLYENDEVVRLLTDTHIITQSKTGFSYISHTDWKKILTTDDAKNAFLRGVFLCSGSVSDPEKYNHMEFAIYDKDFAEAFTKHLNSRSIKCKMMERKGFFVVYLKEAECIVDVLRAIGASTTLFTYENIRITKNVNNLVQRTVNCELANQNKTIDAGIRQKKCIEHIVNTRGWEYFPENLRELAKLRLDYPEASLLELSDMLSKPIGKSGVNHRLKKIQELAEEIN